jgi:hypothetical protein
VFVGKILSSRVAAALFEALSSREEKVDQQRLIFGRILDRVVSEGGGMREGSGL